MNKEGDTMLSYSPLSWSEARKRLIDILELYLKEPFPPCENVITKSNHRSGVVSNSNWLDKIKILIQQGLKYNLDIVFGSVSCSIILLYLSLTTNRYTVPRSFASILLALTSIVSFCVCLRWRSVSCRDSESKKRRIVSNFLAEIRRIVDVESSQNDHDEGNRHQREDMFRNEENISKIEKNNDNHDNGETAKVKIKLNGTSLSDIYTVYRLPSSNQSFKRKINTSLPYYEDGGQWHRVPSLLLVEGDFIALQIGDVAPALCKVVRYTLSKSNKRFGEVSNEKNNNQKINTTLIRAGEKVLSTLNVTTDGAFSNLPPGKNCLPDRSKILLQANGNIRVFQLQETPIDSFLHLTRPNQKTAQVHRQLQSIRIALLCCATVIVLLSSSILGIREGSNLFREPQFMSLIMLAAIGVLPITTPICILLLEVIGTSKILTTVHPHVFKPIQYNTDTENSNNTNSSSKNNEKQTFFLFWRYIFSTISARLSLNIRAEKGTKDKSLLEIPPASLNLFERLGVVNALALVDDELACEPFSTPEQLLLPSGGGAKDRAFKLLDLYQDYGEDDYSVNKHGSNNLDVFGMGLGNILSSNWKRRRRRKRRRKRTLSSLENSSPGTNDHIHSKVNDSSDDSDSEEFSLQRVTSSGTLGSRKIKKNEISSSPDEAKVHFEDPTWWQHLPSLKCIGLACLFVENDYKSNTLESKQQNTDVHNNYEGISKYKTRSATKGSNHYNSDTISRESKKKSGVETAETRLVRHICQIHRRNYLHLLSECIGFSTQPNSIGPRGDISSFAERKRIHVIDARLASARAQLDLHAIGLEESRMRGFLRFDSTSVLIEDFRSKSFQLLTLGDARVVTKLCSDLWQGDTLTITPLRAEAKRIILDTSNNWSLSDLEVSAFAYVPVPVPPTSSQVNKSKDVPRKVTYLLDNRQTKDYSSVGRQKLPSYTDDWSLVENQIFLGLLGSSVASRKEIAPTIKVCIDAGIRFVYFSPRNMRRTKELASQMGIDVAWNCAISLRPLDEGEKDPHRMPSTYADWVTNARLPHGIEDVKKHLEEVDNVPLLVSLYTDVTKESTAEMVSIFQQYHDTVLALGLSHISSNAKTFSVSDISIGVDILVENIEFCNIQDNTPSITDSKSISYFTDSLVLDEVSFVSAIAAHACALNLPGSSSLSYIPMIIAQGRSALEAGTSAGLFIITGHLSFSFFVLFSTCTVSTMIPSLPTLGSVLYLLIILPTIGLSLSFTKPDNGLMERVPPKNDESIAFGAREQQRLYIYTILRALPPAIYPHILYLIAMGEILIKTEVHFMLKNCFLHETDIKKATWVDVIRCDGINQFSGYTKDAVGAILLAELAIGIMILSCSFVFKTKSMKDEKPWKMNYCWLSSIFFGCLLISMYLSLIVTKDIISSLPWYFFILSIVFPFLCLVWSEYVKGIYRRHETRSERFRRLQFETRLGMWSPK